MKTYKGIYNPRFPQKYKGSTPIIYRSGLELRMSKWLDFNSKVVEWTSESVVIPYMSPKDGRLHRYFVDYSCAMINKYNKIDKLLIEVKPKKQTRPPSKRLKPKNYLYESAMFQTNIAKWSYAKRWAEKHGYKFIVITEDFLKNL